MFIGCSNLTSFTPALPNLTSGMMMFGYCSNLTSFTSVLPNLTNGMMMFPYCSKLESFSSDLSNLTNGMMMFHECTNLATFTSDLSNLTNSDYMFAFCENLTSFSSSLPSLTDGNYMFYGCKLDSQSVKKIGESLKRSVNSVIHIGIGCDNTTADKGAFAQEVGYNSISDLTAIFSNKMWNCFLTCNGRPTSTYSVRRDAHEEVLPIYVKLTEVDSNDEELKNRANYQAKEDSKYYILHYFHITNASTDGYTQFNSLEEAIEHFNIKPIERN